MAQVSVIIPIYNVAQYLDKCISSVIDQTFKDIEIVAVNDGSTDDSLSVLEKYASADARIKIVSKQNEGLAMARATGVENATSEYIFHLDGDDYIEPTLIEDVLSEMLKKDADIMMFRFQYDYPDRSVVSVPYPQSNYSNIELLKYLWKGAGYYAVWAYIHKRSLYKGVKFYMGLSFAEDVYLTSQLLYNASNICIYDSKPLLHYLIRNTSISNGSISASKVRDIQLYPDLVREFMSEKPEYQSVDKELICLKLIAYNTLLQRGWFEGAKERSIESVKMLRKYPDLAKVPSVKAFRKLFVLFTKNRMMALLFAKYYKLKGKIY
ncbi:MAG: glycosyltransferase family 2 protein [Bacteroidales bacterium]